MNLTEYAKITKIFELSEVEKVMHLAFYIQYFDQKEKFSINNINSLLNRLGLPEPNRSRLKAKLIKSKLFSKLNDQDFRLHGKTYQELLENIKSYTKSQEIITDNTILPEELYVSSSGFIINISKQINASYEKKIFDGCAVLMRRLIEVLLILSYQKLKIDNEITDSNGNYFMLEKIVANASANKILKLSRNTKSCIIKFRELGNFSAHHLYYLCKKNYIEESIQEYRVAIEELLVKSELKK